MYEIYLVSGILLVLTTFGMFCYLLYERIKHGQQLTTAATCQVIATTVLGIFYIYAAVTMNQKLITSLVSDKNETVDYVQALNPSDFMLRYDEFIRAGDREMSTSKCLINSFLQESILTYSLTHGLVAFPISTCTHWNRDVHTVTKQLLYTVLWFVPVSAVAVLYHLKVPKETSTELLFKPNDIQTEAREMQTEAREMQEQINATLSKIYDIVSNTTQLDMELQHSEVSCKYNQYNVTMKVYALIVYNVGYFVTLCYAFVKYGKYSGTNVKQFRISVTALLLWLPTVLETVIRIFIKGAPADFVGELLLSLSSISHIFENINTILPQNRVNSHKNP